MQTVELLSYILHHISLPLVQAMAEQKNGVQSKEDLTNTIIQLLEKVVQQSEDLKDILEIGAHDKENLALRMHMASLCSKIIASEYKHTGEIPTDNDIRGTIATIDAALVFCEDYIPLQSLSDIYPENANKPASFLKNLADLKYLESTIPLVNAISAFSFGVPPQHMIQNVSEKISHYVIDMRDKISGDNLQYLEQKEASRYILHNLAALYETIHIRELKRIESLTPEQLQAESSEQQITNIWANFHAQYIMLLELTQNMIPGDFRNTEGSNAESPQVASIDDMLDDPFIEVEDSSIGEQDSFKPMSFYKKSD